MWGNQKRLKLLFSDSFIASFFFPQIFNVRMSPRTFLYICIQSLGDLNQIDYFKCHMHADDSISHTSSKSLLTYHLLKK